MWISSLHRQHPLLYKLPNAFFQNVLGTIIKDYTNICDYHANVAARNFSINCTMQGRK